MSAPILFGYSPDRRALAFPDTQTGAPRFITARDLRRAPFPPKKAIVDGEEVFIPQPSGWKASDADLEAALPSIDPPRIVIPR